MANQSEEFPLGPRDTVGGPVNDKPNGLRSPGPSLQVPREGYQITLFFTGGTELGFFIRSINGEEEVLNPWLGVQLCEYNQHPPQWKRDGNFDYIPNDLGNYLKREAVHVSKIR